METEKEYILSEIEKAKSSMLIEFDLCFPVKYQNLDMYKVNQWVKTLVYKSFVRKSGNRLFLHVVLKEFKITNSGKGSGGYCATGNSRAYKRYN